MGQQKFMRRFVTMADAKRGAFVVFEGIDRCGKSTQAKKLVDFLNNRLPTKLYRFPDRTTPVGQLLDKYLTNKQNLNDQGVHLLFSANRWELKDEIELCLKRGVHVICDRYAYSGVAFSAAKGLDLEWCKNPDKGLPAPDVVLFLDISVADSMQRGGFGGERYEKKVFQEQVLHCYSQLKDPSWKTLDAKKGVEDLHTEVIKIVEEVIKSSSNKAIESLWL